MRLLTMLLAAALPLGAASADSRTVEDYGDELAICAAIEAQRAIESGRACGRLDEIGVIAHFECRDLFEEVTERFSHGGKDFRMAARRLMNFAARRVAEEIGPDFCD